MAAVRSFIQQLTKAELHVHLEGSIEPDTLMEIDPTIDRQQLEVRYAFTDFSQFLKNFGWIAARLREPCHYALAARRLLERLERENVRYVEITLSAGVVLWKKQDLEAVHRALRKATRNSAVETLWIWDAVRQWGPGEALRVAEAAAAHTGDGVVAFGLGGDEAALPASEFREVFQYAARRGLRLVCHAGEMCGPESVWGAIDAGAERIGHGIASVEDANLLRCLASNRIPLEICISSNLRTGAAQRFKDYPLRRLLDAGVPVVLNTDDPALFQTTLCKEYECSGLSEAELVEVAGNGFRYAFGWKGDPPA